MDGGLARALLHLHLAGGTFAGADVVAVVGQGVEQVCAGSQGRVEVSLLEPERAGDAAAALVDVVQLESWDQMHQIPAWHTDLHGFEVAGAVVADAFLDGGEVGFEVALLVEGAEEVGQFRGVLGDQSRVVGGGDVEVFLFKAEGGGRRSGTRDQMSEGRD